MKEELGKYFLDISKLVFAGSVIAGILEIEDISKIWILISGLIATTIAATLGFYLIKNK